MCNIYRKTKRKLKKFRKKILITSNLSDAHLQLSYLLYLTTEGTYFIPTLNSTNYENMK